MTPFQILVVPLCLSLAIREGVRLRRGRTSRFAGSARVSLWLAAAALVWAPDATIGIAQWIGIGRGADLVFYTAVLVGLHAFWYFYNRTRRLEILLTELARFDALERAARGGGEAGEGRRGP